MGLKFTKNKEDFVCEKCGTLNKGNGYTNHCFECLWSKHVDNFPGDRGSNCGGLMEPIGLKIVKNSYMITHQCKICGYEKNNKSNPKDQISNFLDQQSGKRLAK